MSNKLSVKLPFVYRVRGIPSRGRNQTIEYFRDSIEVEIPIIKEENLTRVADIYKGNTILEKIRRVDETHLRAVRQVKNSKDIEEFYNKSTGWPADSIVFAYHQPAWENNGKFSMPIYPHSCKNKGETRYKKIIEDDYVSRKVSVIDKAKTLKLVKKDGLTLYEGLKKCVLTASYDDGQIIWNGCLFEDIDTFTTSDKKIVFIDVQDADILNAHQNPDARWRIEMFDEWPMKRCAHIDNLEMAHDTIHYIFMHGLAETPAEVILAWSEFSIAFKLMKESAYRQDAILESYDKLVEVKNALDKVDVTKLFIGNELHRKTWHIIDDIKTRVDVTRDLLSKCQLDQITYEEIDDRVLAIF